MLTFSIVDMKISEVREILGKGLGWPKEPMQDKRNVGEIKLPVHNSGAIPAIGVFYHPCINEQKLIFVSNKSDGWDSLLYCITRDRPFEYLSFRVMPGTFPLMEMSLVRGGEVARLVRAMKEIRWDFYEIGDPLWFEDKSRYSKRKISDRVDLGLLLSYSNKNGIDFESSCFFETKKESLWVRETWADDRID